MNKQTHDFLLLHQMVKNKPQFQSSSVENKCASKKLTKSVHHADAQQQHHGLQPTCHASCHLHDLQCCELTSAKCFIRFAIDLFCSWHCHGDMPSTNNAKQMTHTTQNPSTVNQHGVH